MEIDLLKEFTEAVRCSTIKRLEKVPAGYENWRIRPGSLSFAEVTKHLIDIDEWILQKIENPELKSIETENALMEDCSREKFLELIEGLKKSLVKKLEFIDTLDEADLARKIYDDSYKIKMSVEMLFLRRNLDHEIHHRGQIAVFLRVLRDNQ